MDVGVRELKQRLSHYLELVEQGETVVVTDRGRPKAVLRSVRPTGRLDQGIEEGWVSAPSRTGLRPIGAATSHRSVLDVLDEDRAG